MFPGENTDWVKMHTNLTQNSVYSSVYIIEDDHQLYQTSYREIGAKLREFLAAAPQSLTSKAAGSRGFFLRSFVKTAKNICKTCPKP